MKKKICIVLLILCILLVPKTVVKAEDSDQSKSICNSICDSIDISKYYKQDNIDNCKKDCASVEKQCRYATGDASIKCYGTKMCETYSYSGWCKTHDNGNKTKSDTEEDNEEKARIKLLIENVAKAACSYIDPSADEKTKNLYDACVAEVKENLVTSGCSTETACKDEVCNNEKYKNTYYCKSAGDSTDYISNPSKNSSGANGYSGNVQDDLDKKNDYTIENCFGFGEVIYYTALIIKIFQIAAPIILIIWASIDLLRSVIAGDEKKIIEMRKPIIQRFVAAACVFMVPYIVKTVVDHFPYASTSWLTCWHNYVTQDGVTSEQKQKLKKVEKEYINASCKVVCSGDSTCKKTCVSDYWKSEITCYENSNSGSAPEVAAAREQCYTSYSNGWKNNYDDEKSENNKAQADTAKAEKK